MMIERARQNCSSFVIRRSSFYLSILALCLGIGCGRQVKDDRGVEGYWWPEEPISAAEQQQEIEAKLRRVHEFLLSERIGGLLIGRSDNFAWISAGGDGGGRALLFLRDDGKRILIADEAQTKRLMAEDLKGLDCESRIVPWYQGGGASQLVRAAVAEASGGRAFGADIPCGDARPIESGMRRLRSPLMATEITKYRWLGKTCAQAMGDVGRRLSPGMTERGIAAMVSAALARRAILAAEVTVATDERASRFPTAPPSDAAKLQHFVRVGIRARRWGMDAALTRCVQFGAPPDDVRRWLQGAASVCAGFWARTAPGTAAGALFEGAISDYAEAGFPDLWKSVDQGGAIGYGGWDWTAVPGSQERVVDRQVFAWHPEVQGVRMEDTILLLGDSLEVLTEIEGWPVVEAKAQGRIYRLPGILTH